MSEVASAGIYLISGLIVILFLFLWILNPLSLTCSPFFVVYMYFFEVKMDRTYIASAIVFLIALLLLWIFCVRRRKRVLFVSKPTNVVEEEYRSDVKTTAFTNIRQRQSQEDIKQKKSVQEEEGFRSDVKTTTFTNVRQRQSQEEKKQSKAVQEDGYRSDNVRQRQSQEEKKQSKAVQEDGYRSDVKTTVFTNIRQTQSQEEKKQSKAVQEDGYRSDNVRQRQSQEEKKQSKAVQEDGYRSDVKTTVFTNVHQTQSQEETKPKKSFEKEEYHTDVDTTLFQNTQMQENKSVEFIQAETNTSIVSSSLNSSLLSNSFDHVDALKTNKLKKTQNVEALAERFKSTDEVSEAMRRAGLEHCNLIFGVDYTASNYNQGKKTFGGVYLHKINPENLNPYQKVIKVLGKTLHSFASDGSIPAFGFGDMRTKDRSIFSLKTDGLCSGFEDVLNMYNMITPKVHPSGPTNFAPLIYQAISIVKATSEPMHKYHILVIVADGQVTSEKETTQAIVNASNYPLSIIMVGVGDGPWDTMDEYDNKLPARKFDNFEFVDFHRVTENSPNADAAFALHALKEIPTQYQDIKDLGYLN